MCFEGLYEFTRTTGKHLVISRQGSSLLAKTLVPGLAPNRRFKVVGCNLQTEEEVCATEGSSEGIAGAPALWLEGMSSKQPTVHHVPAVVEQVSGKDRCTLVRSVPN